MKDILFSNLGVKGVIISIALLLILLNGCLFFKKNKNDSSAKSKALKSYIGIFIIIFYAILLFPLDKFMDFNSVEEAYHFQNPEGKIVFKKIVGNTAFVNCAEVYKSEKEHSSSGVYTFYINNGDHWKAPLHENEFIKYRVTLESKKGKSYYLYNLYSEKDNITGIFIHAIFSKNNFTKNTKIGDSKNTVFEGFYGLSDLPSEAKQYIFLGIVKGKIDEKYYVSIDNEKYYIKDLMRSLKNRI